jgi:hypothetical protein
LFPCLNGAEEIGRAHACTPRLLPQGASTGRQTAPSTATKETGEEADAPGGDTTKLASSVILTRVCGRRNVQKPAEWLAWFKADTVSLGSSGKFRSCWAL